MADIMGLTSPAITSRQPCKIAPAFIDAITPPEDQQQLKQKIAAVKQNIQLQTKEATSYAHNQFGECDCCKTLHVSLFFDGTNNHRIPDVAGHTLSNVARLYRATIGPDPSKEGPTSPAVQEPEEKGVMQEVNEKGYYAYYASGVGTVFEPVNDNVPSQNGLVGAYKGEARINWMLTRIVDILYRALGLNEERQSFDETLEMVNAMDTGSMWTYPLTQLFIEGKTRRKEQIDLLLNDPSFQEKLKAQQKPKGTSDQPKILSMRLYIYGFSRGAAEARTFCNWLEELLEEGTTVTGEPCLTLAGIPIIIEFLGIFDTVPAVGFANSVPFATGHMAWADIPYMRIPDNQHYLKKCVHLMAAHEQRASFAVDSIRRRNRDSSGSSTGQSVYRAGTEEYIYPGVHSDIGGGYAPNDQGKGLPDDIDSYDTFLNKVKGKEYRYYGYNLSQLTLHHMYQEAFKVGAPLKIHTELLPELPEPFNEHTWRELLNESVREFGVQEELLQYFNAWRSYAGSYNNQPVEDIIKKEIALITAWRISRYNPANTINFNFYKRLPADVTKEQRSAAERAANRRLRVYEKQQKLPDEKKNEVKSKDILSNDKEREQYDRDQEILANMQPPIVEDEITPYKMYEPMLDKRQILAGARDFYSDYNGVWNLRKDPYAYADILLDLVGGLLYLLNEEDEAQEYVNILRDGKEVYKKIFDETTGEPYPEYVDLVKLFDNQVHDSRAWFMNSTKSIQSREPATSYFTYRRIQLGDDSNKPMTPVVVASKIVGLAVVTGAVALTVKRKNAKYLALLLAPTLFNPATRGRLSLPTRDFLERSAGPDITYTDALTGMVLPMVTGAKEAMTYTTSIANAMAKAEALPEPVVLTPENASSIPNGEAILQAQQEVKAKQTADIKAAFSELLADSSSEVPTKKSSFLDQLADKAGIELGDSPTVGAEPPKKAIDKASLVQQIMQLDTTSTMSYQNDAIVSSILDEQPPQIAALLKQVPANEWVQQLKAIGII